MIGPGISPEWSKLFKAQIPRKKPQAESREASVECGGKVVPCGPLTTLSPHAAATRTTATPLFLCSTPHILESPIPKSKAASRSTPGISGGFDMLNVGTFRVELAAAVHDASRFLKRIQNSLRLAQISTDTDRLSRRTGCAMCPEFVTACPGRAHEDNIAGPP